MVLYDSQSFLTHNSRTTSNSSKWSVNFLFDTELLQHKVYKGALRTLMRRRSAPPPSSKVLQPQADSTTVQYSVKSTHDSAFSLLGCGSGLAELLWILGPDSYPQFSVSDRVQARDSICRTIILGLLQDHKNTQDLACHVNYDLLQSVDGSAPLASQVIQAVRHAPCRSYHGHLWCSPLS